MQTIGIDVGKRQHIAAICHRGEREARRAVFRFTADRAGFSDLERWMSHQGEIARAVLESSGHYHLNLAAALQQRGVPVAVVNPLESKYFGKRRLQRTKSDPADARTLALLAMVDQPETRDVLAGAELREAARFAMGLVDAQGRIRQRITRLVELGFPELERAYAHPRARPRVVPGVGPAICATLIAEIGDIRQLSDFDKLVVYIGVHPPSEARARRAGTPRRAGG